MRWMPTVLLLGLAACEPPDRVDTPPDTIAAARTCAPVTPAMRWVPGGSFTLGEDAHYPEEGPPRRVDAAGFWIDAYEVTNAQFTAFVAATGYVTLAERKPPVEPATPPDMRVPGSAVFNVPTAEDPRWWRWATGAQWRHPSGPDDAITSNARHPVVQIGYDDAVAYARWAGRSLPTEEQWEYAARGGTAVKPLPVSAQGAAEANIYQGVFPVRNLASDGFVGRAPAGCFPANGYGLHDMIGNVWEWTLAGASGASGTAVIKGGSFLCAANYCARYRPAARQFQERGLGTEHIGFRLVDNRRPPPSGHAATVSARSMPIHWRW